MILTIGLMVRKVVEDFCQWLIAASKESAAKVEVKVDWDQMDSVRQKLSTMRSKKLNSQTDAAVHASYMTDVYRENTQLGAHLSFGGRQRTTGTSTDRWTINGETAATTSEFQQQLRDAIYKAPTASNNPAYAADDDWNLRQQRDYYNQPGADDYAQAGAGQYQAGTTGGDANYQPLMIEGIKYSVAPEPIGPEPQAVRGFIEMDPDYMDDASPVRQPQHVPSQLPGFAPFDAEPATAQTADEQIALSDPEENPVPSQFRGPFPTFTDVSLGNSP